MFKTRTAANEAIPPAHLLERGNFRKAMTLSFTCV
jgi:hypothetical protein